MIALKTKTAGLLLAVAAIILTAFGPVLPRAVAGPPEEELDRLASRYASTTCAQLTKMPDEQGVKSAIGDVMDRNAIPRLAAERVVWLSVKESCPQYRPTVERAVSPEALQPAN